MWKITIGAHSLDHGIVGTPSDFGLKLSEVLRGGHDPNSPLKIVCIFPDVCMTLNDDERWV